MKLKTQKPGRWLSGLLALCLILTCVIAGAIGSYAAGTVPENPGLLTLEGNEIILDVSRGDVTIGAAYSGYVLQDDGKTYALVTDVPHVEGNTYVISGSTSEYTIAIDSGTDRNIVVKLNGINIDVKNTGTWAETTSGVIETKTLGKAALHVNGSGNTYIILANGTTSTLTSGLGRAGLEKEGRSTGLLWISCETNYVTAVENGFSGNSAMASAMASHNATGCSGCGHLKAAATDNPDTNFQFYCGAGIGTRGYAPEERIDANQGSPTDATVGTNALNNLTIAGGNIVAEGGGAQKDANGSFVHAAGAAGIGSGAAAKVDFVGGGVDNLVFLGGNVTAKGGATPGACIGGGYLSGLCRIWIYGGTITATERTGEGLLANNPGKGAGIGAGGGGAGTGGVSPGYVWIYGGTITAGSGDGAAIGGSAAGSGGVGGKPAMGTDGYVYIYGGNITATTSGKGAAIGGGGSAYVSETGGNDPRDAGGGAGYVEISGGTIIASSTGGADIGGGGCASKLTNYANSGGEAAVTISGNANVTAQKGGIGGGSAQVGNGGSATVTISGGTVKAASIGGGSSVSGHGGDVTNLTIISGTLKVTEGIGGGESVSGDGGSAKLTIFGGLMNVGGSIGGGSSQTGFGGTATVIIHDGTAKADSIGGGFSTAHGYAAATITIDGGSVNAKMSVTPRNNANTPLYNNTLTVYQGETVMSDTAVTGMTISNLSSYGCLAIQTDADGKLYLWLPNASTPESLTVCEVTATPQSMGNRNYFIWVDSDNKLVYINFPHDDRVILSDESGNPISNNVWVVGSGTTVKFGVTPVSGYTVQVYYASSGTDSFIRLISGTDGTYSFYAQANTQVIFVTTGSDHIPRMSLDLRFDNITISADKVTLGNYSYTGSLSGMTYYLTSGGIPTANYLQVSADSSIFIDQLTAESVTAPLRVTDGAELILTASTYDNSITSTGASAITVEHGSALSIRMDGQLRLKSNVTYTIGGAGDITLIEGTGNLSLIYANDTQIQGRQLTVEHTLKDEQIPYSFTPASGTLMGYLCENVLQPLGEALSGRQFVSCALHTVSPADVTAVPAVTDGRLTIKLPDGGGLRVSTITQNGSPLPDYTVENGIITIPAASCFGSIEVVITKEGTISFEAKNIVVTYTGKPQTFEIRVETAGASVFYSTDGTAWSAAAPARTDAGTYTFYWKIETDYTATSGSNTLTINQATNEWVSPLQCLSIPIGGTLTYSAVPKFGSVTYTFYDSNKDPLGESPSTGKEGHYFITATVAATVNYTELTTTVLIPFEISDKLTIVTGGKHLELINGYSGTKVSIPVNGAFTVLYQLTYNLDSAEYPIFDFGAPLPSGTKLTLLDMCSGHTPVFGYYIADGTVSSVAINQFTQMGTASTQMTFSKTGSQNITYQLCVVFPHDASWTTYSLNLKYNSSNLTSVVKVTGTQATVKPAGTVTLSGANGGTQQISATASVTGATGSSNVLVVTLLDGNGKAMPFPAGSVITVNGGILEIIRGNQAFFSGISDGTYTISVTGLPAGSYKLQAAFCAAADHVKYPMAALQNRADSEVVSVSAASNPVYGLSMTDRFITASAKASLKVNISRNADAQDREVTVCLIVGENTVSWKTTGDSVALDTSTVVWEINKTYTIELYDGETKMASLTIIYTG